MKKIIIIALLIASVGAMAQSPYTFDEWKYKDAYKDIMAIKGSNGLPAYTGMSDDEVAGALQMKAGGNFVGAGVCLFLSTAAAVSGTFLPQKLYPNDAGKQLTVSYITSGVAGLFAIVSMAELISGGTNLKRAGVIIQHKQFSVKAAPGSVSLNF